MKKIIALFASLIFFAGAVSCGKKSDSSPEIVAPDGNVQDGSQEKIPIKIFSTVRFHYSTNDPINRFVSQSGKYSLEETEFFHAGDDAGDQPLMDMNIEILSGNIPDIVVTLDYEMEKLRKNGYLADLTPLMEGYDGTKPDDLLPNVRDSVTHNGEIYRIFDNFYFYTAAAKSSHFDKDMTSWSYKDAIDAYKNMPEGMDFACETWEESVLWDYMLKMTAYDSISFEDNTCDFSGAFRETLEFLQGLPPFEPVTSTLGGFELGEDKVLVGGVDRLKGLDFSMAQLFYDIEGSELTFVGYPSINSSGAYTRTYANYGIMDVSSHKEDAWAILNSLLALEYQSDPLHISGAPVISPAIPEITSNKYKYTDFALTGCSNPSHFDSNKTWSISPEQKQQAIDYVSSIRITNPLYSEVYDIIQEEYIAVMNGEQSADECVDMLNNRIGLYLSENS